MNIETTFIKWHPFYYWYVNMWCWRWIEAGKNTDHFKLCWYNQLSMMTSLNGNIFRVTGHCAVISPVPGEFPAQRPVTRNFDIFFDLRLNKRLSKQSRCWWFETPSRPLWRHRNVMCRSWIHARLPHGHHASANVPTSTFYVIHCSNADRNLDIFRKHFPWCQQFHLKLFLAS